jgi:hypothetical protein
LLIIGFVGLQITGTDGTPCVQGDRLVDCLVADETEGVGPVVPVLLMPGFVAPGVVSGPDYQHGADPWHPPWPSSLVH